MYPLALASSQNEECDSAAERRWENEGGNPGQLQRLSCDDGKEDGTTGPARGALTAFCYEVDGRCGVPRAANVAQIATGGLLNIDLQSCGQISRMITAQWKCGDSSMFSLVSPSL